MNLRPFTLAAVTPLALPDISSNAIDGMYFIASYSFNKFLDFSIMYSAAVTIASSRMVSVMPPVFILNDSQGVSSAGTSTVLVTILSR